MKVKILSVNNKDCCFSLNNNLIKIPVKSLTFEVKEGQTVEALKDGEGWMLMPVKKMSFGGIMIVLAGFGLIGFLIECACFKGDKELPQGSILFAIFHTFFSLCLLAAPDSSAYWGYCSLVFIVGLIIYTFEKK